MDVGDEIGLRVASQGVLEQEGEFGTAVVDVLGLALGDFGEGVDD